MKHIKFFETKEKALLLEIENPSVLKIEDKIYYSEGLEGLITEVTDDSITVVSKLNYLKSQPLTITNIGNTEGTVAIIVRNPNLMMYKIFNYSGYFRFYKNGYLDRESENLSGNHNSYNYIILSTILQPGESVEIKASTTLGICNYNFFSYSKVTPYLNFDLSGSTFKASGNLMSIETSKFDNLSTYTKKDGLFWRLFENCTNLIDIKDLYCPIVGQYCYRETFYNSGVKHLPIFDFFPDLFSLNDYNYCCQWMFKQCNNLIDLSNYILFDLEYLIGEGDCYGMFDSCENLEKAPVINRTYYSFNTFTYMFNYCSNLLEIKYLGDGGDEQNLMHYDWVYNVAPLGTMYVTDSVYTQWTSQGCSSSTYPCDWELKIV